MNGIDIENRPDWEQNRHLLKLGLLASAVVLVGVNADLILHIFAS